MSTSITRTGSATAPPLRTDAREVFLTWRGLALCRPGRRRSVPAAGDQRRRILSREGEAWQQLLQNLGGTTSRPPQLPVD